MMGEYPKMNHLLTYNHICEEDYYLENVLTTENWVVGQAVIDFLSQLNGEINPYELNENLSEEDVDDILSFYTEHGWLEENSRITKEGLLSGSFSLGTPIIKKKLQTVARILNIALTLVFLPVFISGINVLVQGYTYVDKGVSSLWGVLFGAILSGSLRQISRAAVCIANGGCILEWGLQLEYFFPQIYTCIDMSNIKSHLKRAQVEAAGLEMNMFLTGLSLLALKMQCFDSGVLVLTGLSNLVIAIFNLTFSVSDGEKIISSLLGVKSLVEKAKYIATNRTFRNKLKSRGISGVATILLAYIVLMFQSFIPLYLIILVCLFSFL